MNRIISAADNTGNYNLSNVTYDKNGNIQGLTRNGWQDNNGTIEYPDMDILDYDYSGNQLTKVSDSGNGTFGFKDGVNQTIEYTYDSNANMIGDANKGISAITYNHLNLPEQVTLSGGNIQYVYDADGNRIKKIVTQGSSTTETEYAGGKVYENNELQFFPHPEGYVATDGSGGFYYVYHYRDHVDNIRLSYTDADGNGSIDPANEIIEESNFYPFGLKMLGFNGNVSSLGNSVAQRWKFGGKEYEESLDLNTYDFGARNYDPALGRWMNIDPLAEQMRRHSPYNYALNNPIYFQDPDGMMPCPTGDCPDPPKKDEKEARVTPVPVPTTTTPGGGQAPKGFGPAVFAYALYTIYNAITDSGESKKEGVSTLQNEVSELKQENTDNKEIIEKLQQDDQNPNDDGDIIYRGGSFTDSNFTPRPGIDDGVGPKSGLSTFKDPVSATRGRGGKAQILSVDVLNRLGFQLTETPDGHVSIRPPSQEALQQWAQSRPGLESGNRAHILTAMVKTARIDQVKVTKIR